MEGTFDKIDILIGRLTSICVLKGSKNASHHAPAGLSSLHGYWAAVLLMRKCRNSRLDGK